MKQRGERCEERGQRERRDEEREKEIETLGARATEAEINTFE